MQIALDARRATGTFRETPGGVSRMAVIDFPRRRPRAIRPRPEPRPYELARRMRETRRHELAIAAEKKRLLQSLGQLERLTGEIEAIQSDLDRLRSALRHERPEEEE